MSATSILIYSDTVQMGDIIRFRIGTNKRDTTARVTSILPARNGQIVVAAVKQNAKGDTGRGFGYQLPTYVQKVI